MLLQEPIDPLQVDYLQKIGLLKQDEEIVEFKKAGEGNMNVVILVLTDQNAFILKQSRPFVAKYPQVPAPENRIVIEKNYYEAISVDSRLAGMSPKILAFDQNCWLMALEFFAKSEDFTLLYAGSQKLDKNTLKALAGYLKRLHSLKVTNYPDNLEMKALNHQHIFELPFQKVNGFDLDKVQIGLQELSRIIKENSPLVYKVKNLGDRYLSKGKHLLHGDFYPGSWLKVPNGVKIIDTEFSFMGDAEFDLGVMLAHLLLAKAEGELIKDLLEEYDIDKLDSGLLAAYAGTEVLRRLFGLAQLPLEMSLEEKQQLAEKAINMVLNEK
jgi:5-methylthioribose kinase